MKKIITGLSLLACVAVAGSFTGCKKTDPVIIYYDMADQMARPAINTVFVLTANKNTFNATVPSLMGAQFQAPFQSRLLALNPGYTTNALTQTAAQFSTFLATDVLNVKTNAATVFGSLSGRGLADDVIDTELTLIFGGPTGAGNPGLIKDNVNANDKAFSAAFPYLAAPF